MRFATPVGVFEIDSVPSQPQVAHCHGFFVHRHLRGHGMAHRLKTQQMGTLFRLGYDFATCTVCASNAAQKKVLARAGWRSLASFVSSKTGEPVELWGFAVREERCSEGSVAKPQRYDEAEEFSPDTVAGIAARKAIPLSDWHEDIGAALWWRFPVEEPPYCGSPVCDDWPGYHTHWTPILVPHEPAIAVVGDAP